MKEGSSFKLEVLKEYTNDLISECAPEEFAVLIEKLNDLFYSTGNIMVYSAVSIAEDAKCCDLEKLHLIAITLDKVVFIK